MSLSDTERSEIRQRFLKESATYRVSSPLFSALGRASADDLDIVELVSETRPGQSKGLLIFYVVHYMLLKQPDDKLSHYFPSLTEDPLPASQAFPVFKEYCLEHRSEISELLSWRTVNTNLAEKTICLIPALRHIEKLSEGPLTLLELCCSTGLNMLFDEYHYDYGVAGSIGVADSPVRLKCKLIGPNQPDVTMPEVAMRMGVDLVKVNVSDPLERLWMQAVLCPEWKTERVRLDSALAIRAQRELRIVQGDALEIVGPLLEELPGNLCILMSYCIGHWSLTARSELNELLRRASLHRQIHRLDVDPPDNEDPRAARERLMRLSKVGIPVLKKMSPSRIDHTWYRDGQAGMELLGEGDIFGEWLDWRLPVAVPA